MPKASAFCGSQTLKSVRGRRLWPVELALRFDKEEAEALWQLFEPIDAKCVTT